MIAAVILLEALDSHFILAPCCSNEAAATVGCHSFKARRFGFHELTQRCEHLRQTWLQKAQKFFRGLELRHGEDMLTMLRRSSNLAPGYPEAAIAMTRIAGSGLRI